MRKRNPDGALPAVATGFEKTSARGVETQQAKKAAEEMRLE